jgi:hypothetical protein
MLLKLLLPAPSGVYDSTVMNLAAGSKSHMLVLSSAAAAAAACCLL